MKPEELELYINKAAEIAKKYFHNLENRNVLPDMLPGDLKKSLPEELPQKGEDFHQVLEDFEKQIIPASTHWNHPGFMAYFSSTASGPGIVAELLMAVLNNNAMLWKTSPAGTELEEVMMEWLRKLLNIKDTFRGFTYDSASISVMHALSAARENLNLEIRDKGIFGRDDLPALRLYCSPHTHSSVDKAALLLGVGLENIIKIPCDENFAMIPALLEAQIEDDLQNGYLPLAVVSTIGTTSSTAIDPVAEINKICMFYNIWHHVDLAYAGVTMMLEEKQQFFIGLEDVDSLVVNPHKWLFVPIDLSTLYIKNTKALKNAFSLIPEYLKTDEEDEVTNYMDYGIQLGRRFRSLKLWFILRYYGAEGLKAKLREHITLAEKFMKYVNFRPRLELLAPVNFSTVCFRAVPNEDMTDEELNAFNEKLLKEINNSGKVFFSHTKLNGIFTIRIVFSGILQNETHLKNAHKVIDESLHKLISEGKN